MHPGELFARRRRAGLKTKARDRRAFKEFFNCRQPPGMFRVGPLHLQAGKNLPHPPVKAPWQKRHIGIRTMSQHALVVKHDNLAFTKHPFLLVFPSEFLSLEF
ncbi:MAG: hypothetical protein M8357_11235 [Desulfobulbaceae bacterium]|nr:hypothetical protein [Desulfobulbaceae bacterium]